MLKSSVSPTFTSIGSDLCKGVITAVTLTTYDPALAGTLAADGVAGSRLGAHGEALAGEACIPAFWAIVVFLQEEVKNRIYLFHPRKHK